MRILTVLLAAGAALAAPVVDHHLAAPTSRLDRVGVGPLTPPDDDGVRLSDVLTLESAVLVAADVRGDGVDRVELRARHDGRWGPWKLMQPPSDFGDEAEHHDHAALDGVSEPIWIGRSEALQLRAVDPPGSAEVDLVVVEMEGGDGLAYEPPRPGAGAAVAAGGPEIVPRSAWDPKGECRPARRPEYGAVKMASVHHTVMYPHYRPEDADDVVRALCLFHVEERGFDDLGYNFLVDQYGRAYEGRAGGIERPVVGAHAAGFNRIAVGVAVIGDFATHPVPEASLATVEALIAWKFAADGVDPHGRVRVEVDTQSPRLVRWPQGWTVNVPTIAGHRDTGSDTLCPGRYLYAALEGTPDRVAELIAAGPEVTVAPPAAEDPPARPTPAPGKAIAAERRLAGAWNASPLVTGALLLVAGGLVLDRVIGRRTAPQRL
ncbi:MAG: N-acetylmuramoyl-L-alanine amidase [Nitriliruptorales bacterium]